MNITVQPCLQGSSLTAQISCTASNKCCRENWQRGYELVINWIMKPAILNKILFALSSGFSCYDNHALWPIALDSNADKLYVLWMSWVNGEILNLSCSFKSWLVYSLTIDSITLWTCEISEIIIIMVISQNRGKSNIPRSDMHFQ